jgi:hypothetical protein
MLVENLFVRLNQKQTSEHSKDLILLIFAMRDYVFYEQARL